MKIKCRCRLATLNAFIFYVQFCCISTKHFAVAECFMFHKIFSFFFPTIVGADPTIVGALWAWRPDKRWRSQFYRLNLTNYVLDIMKIICLFFHSFGKRYFPHRKHSILLQSILN